jgi:predicted kinase
VISSEQVRAALFGLSASPQDKDFTQDEQDLTYRGIQYFVQQLLPFVPILVVEGVFRSRWQRGLIEQAAMTLGAEFRPYAVICESEELRRRLTLRAATATQSPAGPEATAAIQAEFAPFPDSYAVIDNTNGTALEALLLDLRRD